MIGWDNQPLLPIIGIGYISLRKIIPCSKPNNESNSLYSDYWNGTDVDVKFQKIATLLHAFSSINNFCLQKLLWTECLGLYFVFKNLKIYVNSLLSAKFN